MATRYWVGGSGNLDGSTTTHISASSGGAGGASYPGSSDTLVFNSSSGGGTVTVTAPHTLGAISLGDFGGTWNNSGNHNFTFTGASGVVFDNNGGGTRTITLGSATYTLSGDGGSWDTGSSGLTLSASSATIAFTGTAENRIFSGGGKNYGTVTYAGTVSGSGIAYIKNLSGTIGSLVFTAPIAVNFQIGGTHTITSLTASGSSSNQIYLTSDSATQKAALAVTSATLSYAAFRNMGFTGSPSASNSFDLGNNSGITITGPGVGVGSGASFSATIF